MAQVAEATYSTGRFAKLFKTSSYHVRKLLEAGLLDGELTDAQRWQIPVSQAARFEKSGLPPIPQMLNSGQAGGELARKDGGHGRDGLIAPASAAVIDAHEQADITGQELQSSRNRVERLKLKREATEIGDFFRGRRQQETEAHQAECARQEQLAERERQRQAEAEERVRRQEWFTDWQQYALRSIPTEARDQVEIELYEAVGRVLARLESDQDADITQRLVDAGIERVLKPWRRAGEVEKAVQSAVDGLPSGARSYFKPTAWQIKATQAAREAIRQVDQDASLPEIEAAARRAVEVTAAEFEALQAAKADAEWREWITKWVRFPEGLSDPGKQMATQAIREALAALPLGTPRDELERAKEQALAPFHAAVAQLRAEAEAAQRRNQVAAETERQRNQRDAEAERQRNDHAETKRSILVALVTVVPWDATAVLTPAVTASVTAALDALPATATRDELARARDQALLPHIDAYRKTQSKERLIAAALSEIHPCLVRLERDWRYGRDTPETLAERYRGPIRAALQKRLSGGEPREQLSKLVRTLVLRQLSAAPEPAVAR